MSQRKNEKGVSEMTDGIGRIFGGNSYGVGGYVPQRQGKDELQSEAQSAEQPKLNPVDVDKVLDYMAAGANFVKPKSEAVSGEVDSEVAERVTASMDKFTEYMAIIEKEFGKELAPDVMDLVMDKLM